MMSQRSYDGLQRKRRCGPNSLNPGKKGRDKNKSQAADSIAFTNRSVGSSFCSNGAGSSIITVRVGMLNARERTKSQFARNRS